MSSQQDTSYLADLADRRYPLEPNKEFTIGRGLGNTLTIEDLKISRTHCRLKEFGGFWSIIDESANGIYLNEKRIHRDEPLVLANGDAIKFTDQVQFRFVEAKSAVAADIEMSNIVDQIETEHRYNTTSAAAATATTTPTATPTTSANAAPSLVAEATMEVERCREPAAQVSGEGTSAEKSLAPDVETELQCSICTELFVKAQTLNCSHTFCKLCIDEWKKKNKVCPICRANIKTVTPTIILDNLANTIIQSSSDEVKQSRRQLLEERNKISPAKAPKARGRRARTNATNTRASARLATIAEPVLISSDDETESDEEDSTPLHALFSDSDEYVLYDDDDDYEHFEVQYTNYVPGDPHAYYGGYGSCFHCGARGHWANGCPLR